MVPLVCMGSMKVIDFYSGIGGFRCALEERHQIVAAFDIDHAANRTYEYNYGYKPMTKDIMGLKVNDLAKLEAELWTMSPPCQPFCKLGNSRDLDDPRCRSFIHLMTMAKELRPAAVLIENVPGFVGTAAYELWCTVMNELGYYLGEAVLNPLTFGIPNHRERWFGLAAWKPLTISEPPVVKPKTLTEYLEDAVNPELYLDSDTIARFGGGFDLVSAESSISSCFIGGYGRLYVRSGSYLKTHAGIRRLSPEEIAKLHHFPATFRFPDFLSYPKRYKLIGNSLNVRVAKHVAASLQAMD